MVTGNEVMILKRLLYFGQEESLSFPVVIVSLSNDCITIQEFESSQV